MKDFFEDLGKRIGETAETVANKAGEAVEIQRLRSQIRSLERENEKDLTEIGNIIYRLYRKNKKVEEEAAAYCEAIENREDSIREYQHKIVEVRGAVKCHACGRMAAKEMSFCPYCGEKIEKEAEGEFSEKVKEKAAETAQEAADMTGKTAQRTAEAVDKAAQRTAEAVDKTAQKTADAAGKAAQKTADAADKAAHKTAEAMDKAVQKTADAADKAAQKTADTADKAVEKTVDMVHKAAEKVADTAEKVARKASDVADKAEKDTGK
ncbi:MAG: zinc ribbon domain-containing protein [Clostridiales bacterium]|nr:zinc ribbon domain-containing protein [Clostridiales bacterium]